jgi:hypothetical protein
MIRTGLLGQFWAAVVGAALGAAEGMDFWARALPVAAASASSTKQRRAAVFDMQVPSSVNQPARASDGLLSGRWRC